ncbi:MAG TPA: hypothetical protein VFT85_07485 [Acidimicrobiia bacterium]|nr:hypothetical protein [Acidimicrobiia bacterium]
MKKLSILTVLAVSLVACGSGDSGDAELPGEPVCIPEGTETPAPEYLGLNEAEAADLAEEQGLQLREVGRDGECLAITMDLRDDRINVEYVDGIVVGAATF